MFEIFELVQLTPDLMQNLSLQVYSLGHLLFPMHLITWDYIWGTVIWLDFSVNSSYFMFLKYTPGSSAYVTLVYSIYSAICVSMWPKVYVTFSVNFVKNLLLQIHQKWTLGMRLPCSKKNFNLSFCFHIGSRAHKIVNVCQFVKYTII